MLSELWSIGVEPHHQSLLRSCLPAAITPPTTNAAAAAAAAAAKIA
jgi:hypothetical protein